MSFVTMEGSDSNCVPSLKGSHAKTGSTGCFHDGMLMQYPPCSNLEAVGLYPPAILIRDILK
jgi:hypothetical protein